MKTNAGVVVLLGALGLVSCSKGREEKSSSWKNDTRASGGDNAPAMEMPAAADPAMGPGGGVSGTGTIGTGRYGTLGNGKGTGSGFGVGGGRGNRASKPDKAEGKMGKKLADRSSDEPPEPEEESANESGGEDSSGPAPSRSWFPETFLFEPLVVTDAQGKATVRMRVPDRLTTWRVLALAHARNGAQAGAVTSFLGTLPTYVEPVVPAFLIAGDEVRLPVQIVNTTETAASGALHVTAQGATVSGAPGGTLTVPASGSRVEYLTLKAPQPGTVSLNVGFGGTDAVVRSFEVLPAGRPVSETRSGTLAAPRTLTLQGPPGANPATDRVSLRVYPGALALLRAELGAVIGRGGVAEDAYALLLAGRAGELLQSLGDKADPDALRTLSILAGQRVIRHARTADPAVATLLAEAALAHPESPVMVRLGQRLVATLASGQRPDGSFGGDTGGGWTAQRMLVATADGVRAVAAAAALPAATAQERQRAKNVRVRASSVFERFFEQIPKDDGYTAAAILASGAIDGPLADKLKKQVLEHIVASGDTKALSIGDNVVRADGARPSSLEATALAVLALQGSPDAPMADLGANLLGGYNAGFGWGDGRTNLTCMQAALLLFKDPMPPGTTITLKKDGQVVTEGVLDKDRLREVLTLEAPAGGAAGAHQWELTATPAVPGLGYALTLESWVPWEKTPAEQGLEMFVELAPGASVGKPVEVTLRAIAPASTPTELVLMLPAGVQVDSPSLDKLVEAQTITSYAAADGKLTLQVPGLDPGRTFAAKLRLIPTLAGKLSSPASTIGVAGRPDQTFFVPPTLWTIK